MTGPFLILAHLIEISFVDNSKERLNTEVPLSLDATALPLLLHCPHPGEHSVPGQPVSSSPLAMQPCLLLAEPEDALMQLPSTGWQAGF